MSDYTPLYMPGTQFTTTTSAAVVGGQLAVVTGSGTMGVAGAGSVGAVGVYAQDAGSGARVTVHLSKMIHVVTAGAAVTAGQSLKPGAAGTVIPWVSGTDAADLFIGIALTTAAGAALVTYVTR